MANFNWKKIISFNGSQQNAFEELVCQLAREEDIPGKLSFERVGTPDGGVEAYCRLDNGDEYGWQAKFFDSMGKSQWKQLNDSFKTAIATHPQLAKYYVCIPMDRADPRTEKTRWFMDKWKSAVAEWQTYATTVGRTVDFEYWGSSELLHRLASEKHAGRLKYWFNEIELSDSWFAKHIAGSIADMGRRYTPELNFDLDIARAFDFLARNERFKKHLEVTYDRLLKKLSNVMRTISEDAVAEDMRLLRHDYDQIEATYREIDFLELGELNVDRILAVCDAAINDANSLESHISDLQERAKPGKKGALTDRFDYGLSRLRELQVALSDFRDFAAGSQLRLANIPILIIDGGAGVGKSHLLADVSKKRLEDGKRGILLLGQHFGTSEPPWTQILRNILRLSCGENEFLGALQAKAEAMGSRILVCIDALNEGSGLRFWHDHIKGFIASFKAYRWLGLVLTIRTPYVKKIAPEDLVSEDIAVRLRHHGFRGAEYEASKLFFRNYGIEQPTIPLLHPDFENPLYLKLFCQALERKGLTRIPEGYEGISTVIDFYLESINGRLSNEFGYSESLNLVKRAAQLVAEKKVTEDLRCVSYEEAHNLIDQEVARFVNKHGFLEALISEGILSKSLYRDQHGQDIEGVNVVYEKFEQHVAASKLLEGCSDSNELRRLFAKTERIGRLIRNENECYFNAGLIQALSVQLPETSGKELYELAPHCRAFIPVIEAFLESLIWRRKAALGAKLVDYVNEEIIPRADALFFDTLLTVAAVPEHFFNADFLHRNLMRMSLANRDAWWTVYLHHQLSEPTPVKRLLDWAWSDEDKSHLSNESILLSGKAIAWFLTSCHRHLRDSATKALIALLENRTAVLLQLLRAFEGVDDPYIYERLFAVAYGCAVRTNETPSLKPLAEYVYQTIFNKAEIYPHVLLRDYARGVIEYAHLQGVDLDVEMEKVIPPYNSDWPKEFPTDDEIRKYEFDYNAKSFKNHYWSQNAIIDSMQPEGSRIRPMYGDFGRYVFQYGFSNWRDLKPQDLSNLAVRRVFELGYDVEKHGRFDRSANRGYSYGRAGRKPERIGKKYQWIAFYELLARVADNFPMYDPAVFREARPVKYEGPWEPYVRDIDPTILIRSKQTQSAAQNATWWLPPSYDAWTRPFEEWLKRTEDLPDPCQIMEVADEAGREWLVLATYPAWEEPLRMGEDKGHCRYEHLWYQIRSYLVREADSQGLIEWCRKKHFMGRWMPEGPDWYQMFSREYYWSPAYRFLKQPYYGGHAWHEVCDRENDVVAAEVMPTVEEYLWEEEYDCSKDEVISFLKPCESIFRGLNMRFGPGEGSLLNQDREPICFDPSVSFPGPMSLLIRKDELLQFLKANSLRVFWTVLGEKLIGGDTFGGRPPSGRLEFSGVYSLSNTRVRGHLRFYSIQQTP